MCTTSSAQRPLCSGKRVLDVEDRASGKQSSIIAEAVANSMCTVIDKYMEKNKVEPKIKEEDETENWRSFLPRRHSASSSQLLGATALPILWSRGRVIPDVI